MVVFKRITDTHLPLIESARKKKLRLFEKRLGIRFGNLELLNLAFCHRSYTNERDDTLENNEKLEFLGDSVLGLIISDTLYFSLQGQTEGEMARIKSFVVSEASLARIAGTIGISDLLLIGRGEEMSGGRSKKALLADCMEAILGAYYLDSGIKQTKGLVGRLFEPEIQAVIEDRHKKDYKTLLQELTQKRYKTFPRYIIVKKSGPDHDKTFWIKVSIEDREFGPGKGKNKKEAEQNAAAAAYRHLSGKNRSV